MTAGRPASRARPALPLEDIPKGPTGKLQRIGLAEKLGARIKAPYVAPSSPMEEAIADIWEEVLRGDSVGRDDNFFVIGGDSVTATMVVARIRERMGVEVPLPRIFRQPTLRGFAESVFALQLEGVPPETMESYLAELDSMTEEEAERLLREDDAGDANAGPGVAAEHDAGGN